MSYESFGAHSYVTHSVVIGKLPVVMIRCAECGWIQGRAGEEFDDIWGAHIDNEKAADRAVMAALETKLIKMRERIVR